ncbi:MAG: hypothetical protein COU09_02870 [Candidatus Harrisonbacteria bacterium CG10_big_fil_rev_8_21_14_0_10_44_23]|uniref:Uncharacterized protein n=1 Tax=Candidatus Harrisonbacteria bacterium CG10_big_fil_rev_8_21_14_0_10_44_23 TaxID=1974585 RepID=A0A2H0UPP3_9BACT|nr:MAG: hypothetical protein COU09_02870 [Candidatus Harrisonbacteria bacterium CG10_big_fil_rev_8_21_14_0_10_44_23]
MGRLIDIPHAQEHGVYTALASAGITLEQYLCISTDPKVRTAVVDALQAEQEAVQELSWDTGSQIERWLRMYFEQDGLRIRDASVEKAQAARRHGFDRLILMAEGLGTDAHLDSLERQGVPIYRSHSIFDTIVQSVRVPDHLYMLWCRNGVEADEENANLSVAQLEQKDCQTLPERIAHERIHNWETHGHLDLRNVSLCAGSRTRAFVPGVCWDARLLVDAACFDVEYRAPGLRARSAVMVATQSRP